MIIKTIIFINHIDEASMFTDKNLIQLTRDMNVYSLQ